MTTSLCQEAFERGARNRLNHPLDRGRYKLEEIDHDLRSIVEDLKVIARYKQGIARPTDISHCTKDDLSIWLKGLPELMSRWAGYYILPAISALQGDGLPLDLVVRLTAESKTLADDLVKDCEDVRQKIRKNIRLEYDLMKSGESLTLRLALEAVGLAKIGLHELHVHRARDMGSCDY